jgi:two-component system NarL family sensor kinase
MPSGRDRGDHGRVTSPPTSVAPAADVRRAPATVAWALGLLLASGLVLTVALPAIGTGWSEGWPWWVHGPVATVAYGTPAVLLLRRDPRSTMGWLLGLVAVLFLLTDASSAWAWRALVGTPGELPAGRTGGEVALWLAWSLWFLPFFLLPTVLLLLAPDGHVASPRWRPAVWVSCVVVAASAAVNATATYRTDPGADLTIPDQPLDITNPLHSPWLQHWFGWVPVLLAPCIAAAVTSLLLRRHRASGLERRQLDVVVCGALATIGIALIAPFTPSPYYLVVVAVALAPYPVALGIAATRHRLWELDLVVRRSVVYGVVTLAVVGVYVVTIALLGGALGSRAGAPLVATAVVAVGAVPLFVRVQRAVDRRLYGDRSDPSAAVRRLADRWQAGERLPAPGATLTAMADDVADSLRLPHVRIVTASGLEGGTGSGSEPAARVPLRRGGLVLGELVASGREPGRAPSRRDVEALHEVAEYVAVVVHNLELSSDLQRSRERVVSAREEERRRLRRELHDGLGPELAAIALQLETVRDLADGEGGTESPAGALAESLRGHVRAVVAAR